VSKFKYLQSGGRIFDNGRLREKFSSRYKSSDLILEIMELRLAILIAFAVIASGCTAGPSTSTEETGNFELYVSDRPADISDFEYLNVTIGEARIFSENFSDSNDSSFRTFEVNRTVDLTQVVGDKREKILEDELEPGTYQKVELHTADILGVAENRSVGVKVPSEKLMITKEFEVMVNETTEFVFDINVVRKGQGGYNLLPVISESGIVEDSDN
jgi:hypothetical protein